MAIIYNLVDTQVYTKRQITNRVIAIEHEVAHLGSGIIFKMRQVRGKWYLKISVDCVGQLDAMKTIIDAVKSKFTYAYTTSGTSCERTMRIGSTAKRNAQQIAKEQAERRSRTLRMTLFDALWIKFAKDDVDFDVDYVSDIVDIIAAIVTKHSTK